MANLSDTSVTTAVGVVCNSDDLLRRGFDSYSKSQLSCPVMAEVFVKTGGAPKRIAVVYWLTAHVLKYRSSQCRSHCPSWASSASQNKQQQFVMVGFL